MNKSEFKNLIKSLAFHFGERVSCEWLSPDGVEWLEWKNAEISVQFLIDLEKGYIRNIQILNISDDTDIIKSETAKTILARSYDGGHICMENAEAAVEAAEKEMIQKAILMFSQVYDMRNEFSKKSAVDMFEKILTQ